MKRVLLILLLLCPLAHATTWYVRSDGGTRYSTNMTSGGCNGHADAPYPGSGVNQDCAFDDIRYLWADGSYTDGSTFPGWGWVGAGGDTYLIRSCIQYSAPGVPVPGSSGDCAIGYSGPNAGDYYGAIAGSPSASGAPSPPSGTAGAHTRILGQNYASCTSPSAKTRVYGAYGTGSVFQVRSSSYVDIACFDITDHAACGRSGLTNQCKTDYPLDNFANVGISSNNTSTNISLTDLAIHGFAAEGMSGPTGDGFHLTRVSIIGNDSAGWNLDAGDGTTGTGTLTMSYMTIAWSGCSEEYPIVDAVPYFACSDDLSGGYGDGWGTTTVTSPGWFVSCDHCTFAYNTQDGDDGLHITGTGSTVAATNSLFYGNMGNQVKIGGSAPTLTNNLIYSNCNALRQAIPGTPSGYNSALSDFCRAGDDAVAISISDNYTSTVQFNTLVGANAGAYLIVCADSCTHPVLKYQNNIMLGFLNNATNGYPGGGSGNYMERLYFDPSVSQGIGVFTNSGSAFDHNDTFHEKDACPNTNETNALCIDPQLTSETWQLYGYGAMTLVSASSPPVGSGVAVPGITTDYAGNVRPSPPAIGALEFVDPPSYTLQLGGTIKFSGSVTF